jgi:hypothetical protein
VNPANNTINIDKSVSIKPLDLDKYLGVYANSQLNLKITISKEDGSLVAQAAGQASFPLEFVEKDTFKFEDGGIEITFQPDKGELSLTQQGATYKFVKQK